MFEEVYSNGIGIMQTITNVTEDEIRNSRKNTPSFVRGILMWDMRENQGIPLCEVCKATNRSHTTCIKLINNVKVVIRRKKPLAMYGLVNKFLFHKYKGAKI